jgi:pheromone shutdown protein TraB
VSEGRLESFAAIGVPVIRPDLTARQARLAWRAVPVIQRLAVVCLVPAFALAFWLFGTRTVLARYLRLEDLPDHVDEQMRQAAPELVKMIVDDRDAMLVEALNSLHQTRSSEPITVAVVYGAGHIPAVIRALYAHYGYRPRAAAWLTVFDF